MEQLLKCLFSANEKITTGSFVFANVFLHLNEKLTLCVFLAAVLPKEEGEYVFYLLDRHGNSYSCYFLY